MKNYNTQPGMTYQQTKENPQEENTAQIPIGKPMKIGAHNGTLRISIPNMIHRMTKLQKGDMIYFKTIQYNQPRNEIQLNLKIIRKNT